MKFIEKYKKMDYVNKLFVGFLLAEVVFVVAFFGTLYLIYVMEH